MKVEYSSNNSGGRWWLKDEHWHALEAAGWKVDWKKDSSELVDKDGRWLGALATEAAKPDCSTIAEAVEEWERLTGQCSTDTGCPCCGQPHSFTLYDDEERYVDSGPEIHYSAEW